MKITVYAETDKIGSRVERTIEVPDDDLEDLSEEDQDFVIEQAANEELFNLINWGWKKHE